MFTSEELKVIKWMAELIKAQAMSDRNAASKLSIAYNDRAFVGRNMTDAQLKIAKCNSILYALDSAPAEGLRCDCGHISPSHVEHARHISKDHRLAAPAEGLDVERLARAWGLVMDGRRIGSGLSAARIDADTTTAADWDAIAREYAALAKLSGE